MGRQHWPERKKIVLIYAYGRESRGVLKVYKNFADFFYTCILLPLCLPNLAQLSMCLNLVVCHRQCSKVLNEATCGELCPETWCFVTITLDDLIAWAEAAGTDKVEENQIIAVVPKKVCWSSYIM